MGRERVLCRGSAPLMIRCGVDSSTTDHLGEATQQQTTKESFFHICVHSGTTKKACRGPDYSIRPLMMTHAFCC